MIFTGAPDFFSGPRRGAHCAPAGRSGTGPYRYPGTLSFFRRGGLWPPANLPPEGPKKEVDEGAMRECLLKLAESFALRASSFSPWKRNQKTPGGIYRGELRRTALFSMLNSP